MDGAKYKTLEDLGTGGALALSQEFFEDKAADDGISPMDVLELLDTILLHELTHAIATPPPTRDIGDDDTESPYGKTIKTLFPLCKYLRLLKVDYLKDVSKFLYTAIDCINPSRGRKLIVRLL